MLGGTWRPGLLWYVKYALQPFDPGLNLILFVLIFLATPIPLEVMVSYLSFSLPLISILDSVCLNSVLIYSLKLYVLTVLHTVYFGVYTRFHILCD